MYEENEKLFPARVKVMWRVHPTLLARPISSTPSCTLLILIHFILTHPYENGWLT
jgi:hypothetical protein